MRSESCREAKKVEQVEPVGLVILLSEPLDVEPGHDAVKLRTAIAEARSRIDDYEGVQKKATLKAKHAEKTVVSVNGKVNFKDTDGNMYSLRSVGGKLDRSSNQMVGATLVWTVKEKGQDPTQVTGPLRWNEATGKLSEDLNWFGWWCIPDAEGLKELRQKWILSDLPVEAERARRKADELKGLVEAAGLLVQGRVNSSARRELFRKLRRDDQEEWERLIEGQNGVPGLFQASSAGRVKISNGPGFELLEDKELCSHVDQLVRHYLGEEPILRTVPTYSFGSESGLLKAVFDNPEMQGNVVVKRVDGRGGDGVWVGAKISRADFLAARPAVEAEPEAFIVQKYTALSQVDGHLVDLRGHSFISNTSQELSGGPGVAVSPVLWGRGVVEEGGNGKVNISDRGFEFAIASCADPA
jgi:hypothetical protein